MSTGIFLTPGAARAAYQVGALHALFTEGGIRPDVIAGASVGSLNGAFAAMGETERLVEIWSGWQNRDIMRINWGELIGNGLFWAPGLASNEPEHKTGIEPYIFEEKIEEGVRFRFNIADLTTGQNRIVEYPGEEMPIQTAVRASVSVPVMFEPVEWEGHQYADGLTIEGCPLETLLLQTGVTRAFVIGVSPQTSLENPCTNVYRTVMSASEWNQYSEPLRAIERAKSVNGKIRDWKRFRGELASIIRTSFAGEPDEEPLLELLAEAFHTAGFPWSRAEVEIIPVMPKDEISMWFGDFQPERSRRLIETGYRDALGVLDSLETTGVVEASTNNPD